MINKGNHLLDLKCCKCKNYKPTGLSVAIYNRWSDNVDKRAMIEQSINTLTPDFDISLVRDGLCFECSLDHFDKCEGITVEE